MLESGCDRRRAQAGLKWVRAELHCPLGDGFPPDVGQRQGDDSRDASLHAMGMTLMLTQLAARYLAGAASNASPRIFDRAALLRCRDRHHAPRYRRPSPSSA